LNCLSFQSHEGHPRVTSRALLNLDVDVFIIQGCCMCVYFILIDSI
jgi:hypothetical protein